VSEQPPHDPYAPDPDRLDPYAPKPQTPDDQLDPYDLEPDTTSEPSQDAQPTAARPAPTPAHTGIASTQIVCTQCGYNLTGVAIGATCPECGAAVDPSLAATTKPLSGLAITSMVLGIISVVSSTAGCFCMGPFVGLPCGVIGLVFYFMARPAIREARVSPGSSGMNTAGLVTSIIGTAIGLIFAAFIAWAIISDM